MLKRLYEIVFLKILGWQIVGELPKAKKYIIIVAPHTSNWDFFLGVFTRRIKQFDPKYVAKKELFVWPFGYFFKWMGGYPVNRSKHSNFVDSVVELFNSKEEFIITLTPEGTRSYNPDWKSGFYYIAKKANVPVMRCGFDYGTKRIVLDELREVEDDKESCINNYKKYFSQFKGKYPKKGVQWEE
jgi:1-acyl-sn-glycerol-3-phosphate acyltransferase